MVTRPKVPWFIDDIKQLKCRRRNLKRKALKSGLPGHWNEYRRVRNQYSAVLKPGRVTHYSNLIDQCAGDSRKLFRVINSLSKVPQEMFLPDHDDPIKLANEFGAFFVRKIDLIKDNLMNKVHVDPPNLAPTTPNVKLDGFSTLSPVEEVCRRVLQCQLFTGSYSYLAAEIVS